MLCQVPDSFLSAYAPSHIPTTEELVATAAAASGQKVGIVSDAK